EGDHSREWDDPLAAVYPVHLGLDLVFRPEVPAERVDAVADDLDVDPGLTHLAVVHDEEDGDDSPSQGADDEHVERQLNPKPCTDGCHEFYVAAAHAPQGVETHQDAEPKEDPQEAPQQPRNSAHHTVEDEPGCQQR